MGRVVTLDELLGELHDRSGRTTVTTNGCFDVLHVGHLRLLRAAKAAGDILVVAVNDDDSVARLKGPGRPLVPLADRMELLAALEPVGYVVPFSEDTPEAVLEAIRPDVHVKGGDYREEDLPEAEVVRAHGGRIEIVPLVQGRSTTGLVGRSEEA
jgi:D-beta-D-heptose 7-phosphate kinase/D-beta-D-heptose 1-phosphate adenosyltransferase